MVIICPFKDCKERLKLRAALEVHIADEHGVNRSQVRTIGKLGDWKGKFLGH